MCIFSNLLIYSIDNIVYISEEKYKIIKNSTLRPNDILFAKTGATIGKTAIIPDSIPMSNTTSHVGKITIDAQYNARYFFYVLGSEIGYKQMWSFAGQKTTRPELSIEEIKKVRFPLPCRKEQDEIVAYLDDKIPRMDELIEKKEKFLEELETYKKSMIYEYVTGKKEVPQS